MIAWIEPSRPSDYRRDVLRAGHKLKVMEYKEKAGTVEISPLGMRFVEDQLPTWEKALQ